MPGTQLPFPKIPHLSDCSAIYHKLLLTFEIFPLPAEIIAPTPLNNIELL